MTTSSDIHFILGPVKMLEARKGNKKTKRILFFRNKHLFLHLCRDFSRFLPQTREGNLTACTSTNVAQAELNLHVPRPGAHMRTRAEYNVNNEGGGGSTEELHSTALQRG